jgi:hypothetical protein
METILIIPRELKYFERLVKLVRNRKDAKTIQAQVATVIRTPNIRRVCINKGVNVGHGCKCGKRIWHHAFGFKA